MIGPARRCADPHGTAAHADGRLAGVDITDAAVAVALLRLAVKGIEGQARPLALRVEDRDQSVLGIVAVGEAAAIRIGQARAAVEQVVRQRL